MNKKGKKDKKEKKEDGYLEHLVELRKRFVISLVFFIIALVVSFFFVPQLLAFIKSTSSNTNIDLNIFNVTDSLYMYMRIASMVALIASTPFLLWQLWLFIKPGMEKNERRFVRRHFPIIILLFFMGIAFAYFVIIPYYVVFSTGLAQINGLVPVIGAREYIDFVVKTVWPFGLAFELPVVIHVLSKIGIVNHRMLKAIRGYAYIGLMVISAFLTPPDPISMGIMLIPLSILYEISIIIAKRNAKSSLIKLGQEGE